jgi:Permuted papain-like amidase enzyme, YaeF/YiiX, C92 family
MTRAALAVLFGLAIACERRPAAPPAFRSGDIVFQESTSRQSEMVRALTGSRWTHMGVVFDEPSGAVVLEASSPVRHTPLEQWITRGQGGHYAIRRLRNADEILRPHVIAAMRAQSKSWLGRPYDLQFRWSDEALYCSELAFKLFDRAARVQIGKIERASAMNLDDPRVKRALATRFAKGKFDPNEPVVTPASIFDDTKFVTIDER